MRAGFYIIALLLFLSSCAGRDAVRTQETEGGQLPEGRYDVIYMGGESGEGGDEAVILDRRGDPYEFELPDSGRRYRLERDIGAEEALSRAGEFLRARRAYSIRMRQVLVGDGELAGYELSPQPDRFSAPMPNAVRIYYSLGRGGKVKLDVEPLPLMERSP